MFRRLNTGRRTLRAIGPAVVFLLSATGFATSVSSTATSPSPREVARPTAAGFVRDAAMARLLGQMLFEDTVRTLSTGADGAAMLVATAPAGHDNSAVARVARTVLSQQSLDRYLWLIQRAYDDSMWRGGDRTRIAEHFPLIWRTSILMYQASLAPDPHRVRVCTPSDGEDEFECRDDVQRVRVVPIPAQAPLIGAPGAAITG